MASCKDCLSYDVCEMKRIVDENYPERHYTENNNCDHFKDRSKFVELSCKVGETVYSIKHNYIDKCKVVEIKIWCNASIEVKLMTKDYIFYNVSRKDFGKTVFLTKEKAEKALEERNA